MEGIKRRLRRAQMISSNCDYIMSDASLSCVQLGLTPHRHCSPTKASFFLGQDAASEQSSEQHRAVFHISKGRGGFLWVITNSPPSNSTPELQVSLGKKSFQ